MITADSHVRWYPSLDAMVKGAPFLGVVADEGTISRDGLVAFSGERLLKDHWFLPQRLIVLPAPGREADWRDALDQCTPRNRAVVVSDEAGASLREELADAAGNGERITLGLYEKWVEGMLLRRWARTRCGESPWAMVFLGFKEGTATSELANNWAQALSALDLTGISVSVKLRGGWLDSRAVPENFRNASNEERDELIIQRLLSDTPTMSIIFDDHGEGLSIDDTVVQAAAKVAPQPRLSLQPFRRSQVGLYQSLCAPPPTRFNIAFFVLSLVEACVAQVAILDERVVEAVLERGSIAGELHDELFRAGIFSLLRLNGIGSSERVNDIMRASILGSPGLKREGIWVNGDSVSINVAVNNGDETIALPSRPDVLLLHDRLVDKLTGGRWNRKTETTLLGVTPSLVRISGGGYEVQVLGPDLPFLDFSIVSSTVYGSLNKFQLVRAAFAARPASRSD